MHQEEIIKLIYPTEVYILCFCETGEVVNQVKTQEVLRCINFTLNNMEI